MCVNDGRLYDGAAAGPPSAGANAALLLAVAVTMTLAFDVLLGAALGAVLAPTTVMASAAACAAVGVALVARHVARVVARRQPERRDKRRSLAWIGDALRSRRYAKMDSDVELTSPRGRDTPAAVSDSGSVDSTPSAPTRYQPEHEPEATLSRRLDAAVDPLGRQRATREGGAHNAPASDGDEHKLLASERANPAVDHDGPATEEV